MRALLINPTDQSITEVQLTSKDSLKELQDHVGGMIGVFEWPQFESDICYCDDYPTEDSLYWTAKGFARPIAGNCLLLGLPNNRGNKTPCTADLEALAETVQWV